MSSFVRSSLCRIVGLLALVGSTAAAAPLLPSEDPFYTPPAGFASSPPGTIFKTRTVEAALLGLLPEPVEAYQLLYRTTAINGSAIATVTTVFKPVNAATDKFVSFQTAEDSSYINCAPSYNYQLFADQTDLIVSVENLIIQAYLISGYIVAAPDYEGPDAAFGPGHLEGMGVLDGMRAVQNFASNLSLSSHADIVGVGYSGGAIATGWAASLQHVYAPELSVKGWVAGGTPANLTGTLVFLDGTVFSGFLPAAIDGLNKPSSYYAQLNTIVEEIETAYGKSELAFADDHCAVDDIFSFSGKSVLATDFQTLGDQLPYEPTIAKVLLQNTMGINKTETPVAPVLLYHAIQDEIIPYDNSSTLFSNWCADGATVHFTTYGSGGHLTTEILGVPPALQYVAAAFAGNLTSGCSQSEVYDGVLDPVGLLADLEPILIHLLDALEKLGDNDDNVKSNTTILRETV